MNTTTVNLSVAGLLFSAQLPVAHISGVTGKPMVAGPDVAKFEQAVADWLMSHGVEGPDSLRILRSAAGLTGSQLAELLNIDRARVSEWENGRAHPGRAIYATVAALAREAIAGRSDTVDLLRSMHEPPEERTEIRLAVG